MSGFDDITLLKEYVKGDDSAFRALVERYINLVYSVALRQVFNPSPAEEITQTVFIILAKKAKSIGPKVILSGWLYQTTRLTAANFLRAEMRRQKHEQEAYMESLTKEATLDAWRQIAPLLEDAMGHLSDKDRIVILLRYFENKSAAEIGDALRIDAPTAQKRLTRAVAKLREFFTSRGVTHSTGAIAGAISAHSVHAAPLGLAKPVSAVALAKGAAASSSTLTLLKGTLKIMAWTKMKMAVAVAAATVFATGTTVVLVEKVISPTVDESVWETPLRTAKDWDKLPSVLIIRPARYSQNTTPAMKVDNISIASLSDDGKRFRKIIARNTGFIFLLEQAYSINANRMILPAGIPATNRFDLMDTLPSHPREALQKAIQQKFGLTGRREMRETDVLLLRVKDPGLFSLHISKPKSKRDCKYGQGFWAWSSFPMDVIADYLEGSFKKPVIMPTEFSKTYDLAFHWEEGQDQTEAYTKELAEAGLELVPSRESIEMLVVEKTK